MSFAKRLTATYYSQGAVFLGSTDAVDEANAAGARVAWQGNAVLFEWPDGRNLFVKVGIGRRRSIVKWCNAFNERSRA